MPNVFQNIVSSKRVYRELRMLSFFKHENVSCHTFCNLIRVESGLEFPLHIKHVHRSYFDHTVKFLMSQIFFKDSDVKLACYLIGFDLIWKVCGHKKNKKTFPVFLYQPFYLPLVLLSETIFPNTLRFTGNLHLFLMEAFSVCWVHPNTCSRSRSPKLEKTKKDILQGISIKNT